MTEPERVLRQQHGFDMCELKASHKNALADIRFLLTDALDALDAERPDLAKRRIERALKSITNA